MNPYSQSFYPQLNQSLSSSSFNPPLLCPTPRRASPLPYLLSESTLKEPNFYYSDGLLNFFQDMGLIDSAGRILVSDAFQLPGLSDFRWLLDVLNSSFLQNISLHKILTTLFKTSECSISIQGRGFYHALCEAGYLNDIMESLGVQQSFETPIPNPPPSNLPLECLITVNDQAALETMRYALLFHHHLKGDDQEKDLTLSFMYNREKTIVLRVSLKNPEKEGQTGSMDLNSYFSGSTRPLVISIPGKQPWETLIYSLTDVAPKSNWMTLLDLYSMGCRSLDPSQEIHALQYFRMSSFPCDREKTYADSLISHASSQNLQKGNEFFIFALQFLCTYQLSTYDSHIFLQTIRQYLKTLDPVTHPLFKLIHSCAVDHLAPFSMIQNLLELAAAHDLHYTSQNRRKSLLDATLTRHNGELAVRISFSRCSRSLLLPFNPAVSLDLLSRKASEWPRLELLYPLYEILFSQKKTPLEEIQELKDCIGEHTAWQMLARGIRESATHPQTLLSHLSLQLNCDQSLHGTVKTLSPKIVLRSLLTALSLPLNGITHQKLLSRLPASSAFPQALQMQLQSLAQQASITPKEIKQALITGLLSETSDIQVLAYPFWLAEAEASKQIDRELKLKGSHLLTALIEKKQWNQALRVLRILSKQQSYSFKHLQTHITKFHAALYSPIPSAEYTVFAPQLAKLTLHAFQNQHDTFLPPLSFSIALFELITFTMESNTPLACDLFLEGISKEQLIPDTINLPLLGRLICRAMLRSPEQTPLFTGHAFAFLVRKNLWKPNQDTAFVCELALLLIKDPRPEAIPLLGACLSVLRKETFDEASIIDFKKIKAGIIYRLVKQYGSSPSAIPKSSLEDHTFSSPKQLAETVIKLIARKTSADSELAYLILTDPLFLPKWIQDPDTLAQATLLWTKNNGVQGDCSSILLMNLLSVLPFDQWGKVESIDCARILTRQLEDTEGVNDSLNPSFLTCMRANHLSIIRHLVHLNAIPETASFIRSLEKHFEKSDWNTNFANVVLKSPALSSLCFPLLVNLISDNLQALGDLRCAQAAKAVQEGHIAEGIALADSLLEIETWHPHSEETQQQLLLLASIALSEEQKIPLAQMLIRQLILTEEIKPGWENVIEKIAEALAAKGNWNACSRWMVENSQTLSSAVIEKWTGKILNIGIDTQNSTLLKECLPLIRCCGLSETLLLSFLKSVSPSNQFALQRQAIDIWQTLEEGQTVDPSVINQGWNIILSFSPKALSLQIIISLIQKINGEEEVKNHSQLAVKCAFALDTVCRYQKKKIQKRYTRQLFKSLESVPKEELEGLVIPFVSFLIYNRMPAEALKFCIHTGPSARHFQSISSKLPTLAGMLAKGKDEQPAQTYTALAELTDRLTLENIRHIDCLALIKNLASLPDDKAYQSACSLFVQHLAVQSKRQFRRSDIRQIKNVLTHLCANANNLSRISTYGTCLDQPFIAKHITESQFKENYLFRLLTESLADKSATVSQQQSALTSFIDHYGTIEKESPLFYENFPLAIRLNLSIFLLNGGKCDDFKKNHQSCLQLIKPQLMKLKINSVRGGSSNIPQNIIKLCKDMIQFYLRCLQEHPLQTKHYATLYQETESLFTLLLEIRPQKSGYDFHPEFLLFFSPMSAGSLEFQTQHLVKASTYFQILCLDKQQIDAQPLQDLVWMLNNGIHQSLSSEALSEKDQIALSNAGFANLKAFFSVVETSANKGRKLYDQMLFALELPNGPSCQNHLNQAVILRKMLEKEVAYLGSDYLQSRHLYTLFKIPDTAKFSFKEKNQIITKAVCDFSTLQKLPSHFRALAILYHGIDSLSGPNLLQCVHSLSLMISKYTTEDGAGMIVRKTIDVLSQFPSYHPTVSKEDAGKVMEEIFSATLEFCKRVSASGFLTETALSQILHSCLILLCSAREQGIHSQEPSRFIEMIESFETLIHDSQNPLILMMCLEFFLKRLSEAMPNPEQQTRRAQLITRLIIRTLSDQQADYRKELIQFIKSLIENSAVFEGNPDCIANLKTHFF